MKLKYPAEAFALGIVLFSRNMKEAFAGEYWCSWLWSSLNF